MRGFIKVRAYGGDAVRIAVDEIAFYLPATNEDRSAGCRTRILLRGDQETPFLVHETVEQLDSMIKAATEASVGKLASALAGALAAKANPADKA